MSVALDILAAYRRPARVFRARLDQGQREDRALAVLMLACLLIFVAQWPRLQREALETGTDFQMLVGGALLGWLFIMPLVAYALGGLSHAVARVAGGRGSWYSARFALFWAMLVAAPFWLLAGLVSGFIGPGPQTDITGFVALLAFLVHWSVNLWVAEQGRA